MIITARYTSAFIKVNLLRLPVIMIITYSISHYLLPEFLFRRKQFILFFLFSSLLFLLGNFIDRFIFGLPIVDHLLKDLGLTYYFFNLIPTLRNAFLLLSIISIVTGIRFYKYIIEQERNHHELEKENLSIKLSMLKSQINPHFTFNALNNIYSIATQNNDHDTAESIHHLSKIMQYLTYDSDVDAISLEKEIDILKSYIYIQYLRWEDSDDVTVIFNNQVENTSAEIPPVLFLPLVEIAFKHGVRYGKNSSVKINIFSDKESVTMEIWNTYFETDSIKHNKGKGLINCRNRLDVLFPSKYTFESKIIGDQYFTCLKIPSYSE